MAKQVEILFDESSGKFVAHFSGFKTHQEEHQMLDQILAKLRERGFDAEVDHHHDKPKLPEFDAVSDLGKVIS